MKGRWKGNTIIFNEMGGKKNKYKLTIISLNLIKIKVGELKRSGGTIEISWWG